MPPSFGNVILDGVHETTRRAMQPYLRVHRLCRGEVLFDFADALCSVWFPTSSVVSLCATRRDGRSVGIAVAGSEGLVGSSLVLGFTASPCRAIVQVAGNALHADAAWFSRAVPAHADLHAAVLACMRPLQMQLIQSTLCNRYHSAEQRLARWLLETADRVGPRAFSLTHDFMALILGLSRPWVTRAIGRLRDLRSVQFRRGELVIVDRAALEGATCECYTARLTDAQRT